MTTTDRRQGLRTGQGLKAPCVVASTAALTLSGEQTIDGIAVGSAQRVLVKDQIDLKENGIYNVGATAWSRSRDFDGDGDAIPGTAVYVDRGPNNGGKFWAVNSSATSTSIVITTFVSSDADDKVWSLLSVALAGVSPFSQDTLFPLGTAAAWRSSDGLDIASTISDLQSDVITTQGDIVRGTTTGAASRYAIGTSGTVLTSTGGTPGWVSLPTASTTTPGVIEIATTAEVVTGTDAERAVTPAGLKSVNLWEEIGTATASGSATISFTWTATYRKVVIVASNVIPATDAVSGWLRTSANAGSSYDSSAADYGYGQTNFNTSGDATQTSAGAAQIVINSSGATHGAGTGANEQMSFTVEILNPSAASNTHVTVDGGYKRANAQEMLLRAFGHRLSAAAVNGIQFLFESGNIASGEFKAYGLV